ncbi:MAG: HAD family phosphatase [Ruminococcaceae bacterium]|nr:HAD family phosphatase [Oscillospiraceae bacterium]
MSIKNVIFDFGQVLVHFEPSYMVGAYVSDNDDKALLEEVVFDRLYWDKLDKGTISNEETMSLIKERLPERLWDVADKIYYNWIYNIPEIDGMSELLSHLKNEHGVRLFLLSNISNYFASHSMEIPILKKLDGLVMSAPIGIVKPSYEIFDHICKKYDIVPNEAIFVDDRVDNIEGAIAYGINGYVFDGDSEKLKVYLDGILTK